MVPFRFTRNEFIFLGLKLADISIHTFGRTCDDTSHERFKDHFYASPKTIAQILTDIQDPDLGDARISNPNPRHLLLALYYLKKYPAKHYLAAFHDSTEKTALGRAHRYVEAVYSIHNFRNSKIAFAFTKRMTIIN
jgi:hypothetical protein